MSRRKFMLCIFDRLVVDSIFSERVIEASMNRPDEPVENISDADLFVIGKHVMEVVREHMTPADARLFALTMLEPHMPDLARRLNPWLPKDEVSSLSNQWINPDPLTAIAIGRAVIKFRDEIGDIQEPISDEFEARINRVLQSGMIEGLEKAIDGFDIKVSEFSNLKDQILRNTYLVEGVIIDANGNPAVGLTVRAVDQDFTAENPLGEPTITDGNGAYKIPYKQTDFVINGKESGGADIILYIYKGEELLKKTDAFRDSPEIFTINVKLD